MLSMLLVLVSLAQRGSAISCYAGTAPAGFPPSTTGDCPGGVCFVTRGSSLFHYGCEGSQAAAVCQQKQTACCGGDLCNIASAAPPIDCYSGTDSSITPSTTTPCTGHDLCFVSLRDDGPNYDFGCVGYASTTCSSAKSTCCGSTLCNALTAAPNGEGPPVSCFANSEEEAQGSPSTDCATSCAKTVVEAPAISLRTVTRGCATEECVGMSSTETAGVTTTEYCCNTDFCNCSERPSLPSLWKAHVAIALLLAILLAIL